jgi:hypothetical protein
MQVCNHPWLVIADHVPEDHWDDTDALVSACGKLVVLEGVLRRLQALGHRTLLFSQMTRVLDVVQLMLEVGPDSQPQPATNHWASYAHVSSFMCACLCAGWCSGPRHPVPAPGRVHGGGGEGAAHGPLQRQRLPAQRLPPQQPRGRGALI